MQNTGVLLLHAGGYRHEATRRGLVKAAGDCCRSSSAWTTPAAAATSRAPPSPATPRRWPATAARTRSFRKEGSHGWKGSNQSHYRTARHKQDADDPLPARGHGRCERLRPARAAGLQQWRHHISTHEGIAREGIAVIVGQPDVCEQDLRSAVYRYGGRLT